MDEIKFFRLISGDEIIGSKSSFGQEGFTTIKKPVREGVTPDGNLGMVQFCPFTHDDECTVKNDHILYIFNVVDEIKNIYNEKYGSGIIVAKNSELII